MNTEEKKEQSNGQVTLTPGTQMFLLIITIQQLKYYRLTIMF